MGYFLVALFGMFLGAVLTKPVPRKGKFTVKAYKNGELVYQKTYVNDIFIVTAGDAADRIEIDG